MQKLFFNGNIITMEPGNQPEAILVENCTILAVGTLKQVSALATQAEQINLHGHTLIPAFIDTHSHFSGYAAAQLKVPLSNLSSSDEILQAIGRFMVNKNIASGEWIVATDYDHNLLPGKKHITRTQLDSITPNNPTVIQHKSGHNGIFNTAALEKLGISLTTKSPDGGIIEQKDGQLTGYLEEAAYIHYANQIPLGNLKELMQAYSTVQTKYASYGITTIQEGAITPPLVALYDYLINQNMLHLDVVGYANLEAYPMMSNKFEKTIQKYFNHFKLGGYKIFLDGSPQSRTAWMLSPYQKDSLTQKDYFGYGTMSDCDVANAVTLAAQSNTQILAHCNGDAAAEQFIRAVEEVSKLYPLITKQKPVMIHAQLLNKSQLSDVKRLGIIPSFFVAHVFYWGDVHVRNFGLARAAQISPAKTALQKGIPFTFHQDTPVVEPNMLETIQCAVTRKTKDGVSLGSDECIPVYDALKAVTINAAFQYSEDDIKGSIKQGKKADLVILSQNPLTVATDKIKEIKVLCTIKDGQVLFGSY